MKRIKSRKDLDDIFKELGNQGFGYLNSYDAHRNKISSLKADNNKLNVSDNDVDNIIDNDDSYLIISKKLKKHYSKYSIDDKIKEYLNKFYIVPDAMIKFPYGGSTKTDVKNWIIFKRKYKIPKDPENSTHNVQFYNLDKSFLKIHDYSFSWYDFKSLYKLLYDKEPDINIGNNAHTNKWYDLGEIQLKYFQNGSINIKGNIEKLKNIYYNGLKNTLGITIKINKKYEYTEKN